MADKRKGKCGHCIELDKLHEQVEKAEERLNVEYSMRKAQAELLDIKDKQIESLREQLANQNSKKDIL